MISKIVTTVVTISCIMTIIMGVFFISAIYNPVGNALAVIEVVPPFYTDSIIRFSGENSQPATTHGKIMMFNWFMGDATQKTGPEIYHTYYDEGPYFVQLLIEDDRQFKAKTTQNIVLKTEKNIKKSNFVESSNKIDLTLMNSFWQIFQNVVFFNSAYAQEYSDILYSDIIPIIDYSGIFQTDAEITFSSKASYSSNAEIINHKWEFGDGTSAQGEMVNHRYDKSGTYEMNLIVEDAEGNIGNTALMININNEFFNESFFFYGLVISGISFIISLTSLLIIRTNFRIESFFVQFNMITFKIKRRKYLSIQSKIIAYKIKQIEKNILYIDDSSEKNRMLLIDFEIKLYMIENSFLKVINNDRMKTRVLGSQSKIDNAMQVIDNSIKINMAQNNSLELVKDYRMKARVLARQGKDKAAIQIVNTAIEMYKKIDSRKEVMSSFPMPKLVHQLNQDQKEYQDSIDEMKRSKQNKD